MAMQTETREQYRVYSVPTWQRGSEAASQLGEEIAVSLGKSNSADESHVHLRSVWGKTPSFDLRGRESERPTPTSSVRLQLAN